MADDNSVHETIDKQKLIYAIVNTPSALDSGEPITCDFLNGAALRQFEILDIIYAQPVVDIVQTISGACNSDSCTLFHNDDTGDDNG